MNQDYKNYFKRTSGAYIGLIGSQIILLLCGVTSLWSSLFAITIVGVIIFAIYLLIFGIKRKDGTRIRFKKITELMKAVGYEDL
jgi:hypothetical protein